MLNGIPVELPAMLAAREERAARQEAWLKTYAAPLISFTLNIPGPVKTSAELRRAFEAGRAALEERLRAAQIPCIAQMDRRDVTGDEVLLAIDGDAAAVKAITNEIEEQHPLGRIFDLDVLTADGTKLSRPTPRRCLLCAEQAQVCARSRRHSVAELTAEIERLLAAHLS